MSAALLGSLELKVLTIQRTPARRWWNYQNVVSPFSRLWMILAGRASVSHAGRRYELTPGMLHLVPAFAHHDCSCPREFDHYHLHFAARLRTGIDLFSVIDCDWQVRSPETAAGFLARLEAIYPDRKLPCFDPFRREYRELPDKLEHAAPEPPADQWFEAQGILKLLLAPFLASARRHSGMHARAADRFLHVQQYIHERMRQPISLADMARVAGLNPTYFSDRFQSLVGVRPTEYLIRRRIERAQYLLVTTDAPVKQIAYEVGLSDAAYFTRVFGKLCGASPSAYRAAHGIPER